MIFWPFLREGRRFYRRNRLLGISAAVILAAGMGTSAVALDALWKLSHSKTVGMRPGAYTTIGEESPGGPLQPTSWRTLRQIEEGVPGVVFGAYAEPVTASAETGGQRLGIRVAAVSSNLFESFALPLTAGPGFLQAGEPTAKEVVLSFHLAKTLFGSPSESPGRNIQVNGITLRVVGVASGEFKGLFEKESDAWIPPNLAGPIYYKIAGNQATSMWRTARVFYGLATGRPAAGIARALRDPKYQGPALAVAVGAATDPAGMARLRTWSGLAVFVAFLLAVGGCLGLAGMLLARAPAQLQEIRMKRALGAGTLRLCLELIGGPMWVVFSGFLGAIAVSGLTAFIIGRQTQIFGQSLPHSLPQILLVLLGQLPAVLAIMAGMAVFPALTLLREGGAPRPSYTGTGTRQSGRFLKTIVISQIVICMCACVVAATVGRAAFELGRRTLGYRSENRTVLTLGTSRNISFITNPRGGTPRARAVDRVVRRLARLPGVNGVAVALAAPMDPSANTILIGEPGADKDRARNVRFNGVSTNYFDVLGTPLIAGHDLAGGLLAGDPSTAIVNETLRKQLWPNGDPIGRVLRLEHPFGWNLTVTVTGVAADQRMAGPKESASPTVFVPLSGNVFASTGTERFIVNGHEPAFLLETTANDELSLAFPGMKIMKSYRIGDRLDNLLADERQRVLFILAGAAALAAMAFVGLYSSVIYFVNARRRELAIRMCCGATNGAIFRSVVFKAAWDGIAAALISIVLWIPLRQLASGGWIGAAAWSGGISASVTLLCLAAVVAAAVGPALQASRIAPASAIRE